MSKKKTLFAPALILAVLASTSWAAKFKGFNRPPQDADLNVPHSPEIVVALRSISIAVDNASGTFPYARQLSLSIEKELTGAFSVVPSGAEGTLNVTVLEFGQPAFRTYDLMEYRSVVPSGNQTTFLALIPQKFPVTYWEAQGLLTLKAVLKDKAGSTIDETILRAPFTMKREIAVNHVASVDHNALPNHDAVMTELILAGARSVRRRYAIGLEPVRMKLTVDNELLSGNQLAMEGDWEGARRAWETVSMKSNAGDREYNMALANYALAFKDFTDNQSIDAAAAHLEAGSRMLASAQRDDPRETYFKEVEGRFAAAKLEMDKGVQQAKALAVERERKTDISSPSAELAANTTGKGLDSRQESSQETEFRNYIHLQWKNRSQIPSEQELAALKQTGRVAWKLSPEQSQRVVNGEAEDWTGHREKEALYLTNLKSFLHGDVLSAEGREQLRKLSANLGLTDAEVAAIEAKVSFHEEGKSHASGAKPVPAKPDSRKASRQSSTSQAGKPQ